MSESTDGTEQPTATDTVQDVEAQYVKSQKLHRQTLLNGELRRKELHDAQMQQDQEQHDAQMQKLFAAKQAQDSRRDYYRAKHKLLT